MLFTTLTALLETAFNAWLKLDDKALARLQALQGRVIALYVTEPALTLFFIPSSDGVKVMSAYDNQPDVALSGSALAFMRLSAAEDSAKAMLENRITIAGSMHIAEQFSGILRDVAIDWEELLSTAVGDVAAYQAGQLARSTQSWLSDSAQAMRMNTQEYLQEESRLLPAETEITRYLHQIDTLRSDADRLEARVRRLQTQLVPASKQDKA